MIRLFGYNLPYKKPIYIALTVIYGIGLSRSKLILNKLNIDINLKVEKLSELNLINIRKYLQNCNFIFEGDLKKFEYKNIKNLIDVKCFRGKRHLKGLPCRGQRTRTNSRTSRRLFQRKNKDKNIL